MRKQIEVEIDLSTEELAREVWYWEGKKQAELLANLAIIKRKQGGNWALQLEYVKAEISEMTRDRIDAIYQMVDQLLKYVEEARDADIEKVLKARGEE